MVEHPRLSCRLATVKHHASIEDDAMMATMRTTVTLYPDVKADAGNRGP
jgi:hypothetical protein